MKKLAILAALFGCHAAPVTSQELQRVAHLGSYHTDRGLIEDVCEINPGWGLRVGNHIEFGSYLNSYCNLSTYMTVDYSFEGPSVFAGVATGYGDALVVPGLVAGVSYHFDNGLTVRAGPSYDTEREKFGAVFGFSYEVD